MEARFRLCLTLCFGIPLVLCGSGCGYSWETSANPWAAREVRSVFVAPFQNNTLTPGVEVAFTSAFVKAFSRGRKVRVVGNEGDADAVLQGRVNGVSSTPSARATLSQLGGGDDAAAAGLSDIPIATEYLATASISVELLRKSEPKALWSQAFAQSKIYPGSNRYGDQGNTGALINSSARDIALAEIAAELATDAYDAMFEVF